MTTCHLSFQEYKYKLENLYSSFYTEKATAIAKDRQHIAVAFYNKLYQEINASYQSGIDELNNVLEDKLHTTALDTGSFTEENKMNDFSINEMKEMQRTLQDKYKHKWEPICPETGQNKLLWMIGEIGEVIDIVKKHGGASASTNAALRKDLIEELADVLMYYNDVLLCYGITAEELKQAYTEKFAKNMKRW